MRKFLRAISTFAYEWSLGKCVREYIEFWYVFELTYHFAVVIADTR